MTTPSYSILKNKRLEDETPSLPDNPQHTVALGNGMGNPTYILCFPNISAHRNPYYLSPVSTFFIFLTFKYAVFWEEL